MADHLFKAQYTLMEGFKMQAFRNLLSEQTSSHMNTPISFHA